MWEICANSLLPRALKSCQKSNKNGHTAYRQPFILNFLINAIISQSLVRCSNDLLIYLNKVIKLTIFNSTSINSLYYKLEAKKVSIKFLNYGFQMRSSTTFRLSRTDFRNLISFTFVSCETITYTVEGLFLRIFDFANKLFGRRRWSPVTILTRFGQISPIWQKNNVLGNFLSGYLLFRKKLNLLWQFL